MAKIYFVFGWISRNGFEGVHTSIKKMKEEKGEGDKEYENERKKINICLMDGLKGCCCYCWCMFQFDPTIENVEMFFFVGVRRSFLYVKKMCHMERKTIKQAKEKLTNFSKRKRLKFVIQFFTTLSCLWQCESFTRSKGKNLLNGRYTNNWQTSNTMTDLRNKNINGVGMIKIIVKQRETNVSSSKSIFASSNWFSAILYPFLCFGCVQWEKAVMVKES